MQSIDIVKQVVMPLLGGMEQVEELGSSVESLLPMLENLGVDVESILPMLENMPFDVSEILDKFMK